MTSGRTESTEFAVEGLDCPNEVAALRAALAGRKGIGELSFNLLRGRMTVDHQPGLVTEPDIIALVRQAGMKASVVDLHRDGATASSSLPRGPLLMVVFAAVGTVAGLALGRLFGQPDGQIATPSAVAYLLAIAAAWRYIAPKAWAAVKSARLDMNVLMTIAVAGAVGIGEWFEASTVALLFLVSHLLEAWSVGRARNAIQSLMRQSPPTATLRAADGTEREVDASSVIVEDHIVVRPGERFALDGVVLEGSTSVDQAPITGESLPVEKAAGSEVFAGTINGDGSVVVRVTKRAGDTVLAGVIRLVEQAQSRRSASERFVDRFARYYTPAVVLGAALLAVVPPLVSSVPWSECFYRALVLLVIACPCALVISTPVSIVSGLTAAARRGVMIKGGDHFEAIADATVVAFDKTGTLTCGRPMVEKVVALDGDRSTDRVLSLAAAIEQRGEHPIARAIVEHAEQCGVRPPPCDGYQAVRGKGAMATVEGVEYIVGNHRMLEEEGLCSQAVHQAMLEHEDCRHTVVAISSRAGPVGIILLTDQLRPSARQAVSDLRSRGVAEVVMLTGDNEGTAKAIADELGSISYRAELLPADKVAAIEELKTGGRRVVMVGDGINDAPALAAADLGIAMGAAATDAALETADIALMSNDPRRIGWLIGHSRRTRRIIIENITLALAIKAVFVALAIPGLANLWMAIAADMGASLLVTFNGLRALASGNRPSK